MGVFVCSDESGPEHFSQVSVDAVDPEHQGERESHKRPGDALGAGTERARLSRGRVQIFTGFEIIPGCEFQHLIQQDDWQRDLQHHQPLGHVQRRDLKDHLEDSRTREKSMQEMKTRQNKCMVPSAKDFFFNGVYEVRSFINSYKMFLQAQGHSWVGGRKAKEPEIFFP